MNLKWWIIIDALVFYMPIPLFIWYGQTELAIWSAESGTFLIIGSLLLYAMGVREVPLNPLKFIRENPKATLIAIAIIVGVMSLCKILNVPPHYP